jgi:hypothetical protein
MAVKPNIDYRSKEEINGILNRLLFRYTGAWLTPEDVESDEIARGIGAGFVKMFQALQERINKVPDKSFLAFLNMLGLRLRPPGVARVPVTFSLVEGADRWAFVPAGTQLATDSARIPEPVVFETLQNITAISTKPVTLVSSQPIEDSYLLHSQGLMNVNESSVETLFDGKVAIPHRLYLTHPLLADLKPPGDTIVITFAIEEDSTKAKWNAFKEHSKWLYFNDVSGSFQEFNVEDVDVRTVNKIILTVKSVLGETKLSGYQIKNAANYSSRFDYEQKEWKGNWIAIEVDKSFFNSINLDINPFRLNQLKLAVKPALDIIAVKPDLAILNTSQLDISKDFFPFGQNPSFSDVFYLACDEAFSKGDCSITITFSKSKEPAANTDANVLWEYFNGDIWTPLKKDNANITENFKAVGNNTIIFKCPAMIKSKVAGNEHLWIRARIIGGSYGLPGDTKYIGPTAIPPEPIPKDAKGNILNPLPNGYILPPAGYFLLSRFEAGVDTNGAKTYTYIYRRDSNIQAPAISKVSVNYTVTSGGAQAPQLVLAYNNFYYEDYSPEALSAATIVPFRKFIDDTPTFYIGFNGSYEKLPVTLFFSLLKQDKMAQLYATKTGIPQVFWEYWNGAWLPLSVIDKTKNFADRDIVEFYGPEIADKHPMFGEERFWIRARQQEEALSFHIRADGVYDNVVWCCQYITERDEKLGSGNGLNDQKVQFKNYPVLPGEKIYIREDGLSHQERDKYIQEFGKEAVYEKWNDLKDETETWVLWSEVDFFHFSKPGDRHYTIDRILGEVTFGNNVNGMMPPIGNDNIVCAHYLHGGGEKGNVPINTVTKLRSSIPYVDSVVNIGNAFAGQDAETTETLAIRGPSFLKSRERALTKDDLEEMILHSTSTVARVKCWSTTDISGAFHPGYVTLMVLPRSDSPKPALDKNTIEDVENYLESRVLCNLAGVYPKKINLTSPEYIQISVNVFIDNYTDIQFAKTAENEIRQNLMKFFHPLKGGPKGDGWPFGRNVSLSEIFQIVGKVQGVGRIADIVIIPTAQQFRITMLSPQRARYEFVKHSYVMVQKLLKYSVVNSSFEYTYRQKYYIGRDILENTLLDSIVFSGFKEGDRIEILSPQNDRTDILFVKTVKDSDIFIETTFLTMSFPIGSVVRTIDRKVESYLLEPLFNGDNSKITVATPLIFDTPYYDVVKNELKKIGKASSEITFADSMEDFILSHKYNDRVTLNGQTKNITASISFDGMNEIFLENNYLVYSGVHTVKTLINTAGGVA